MISEVIPDSQHYNQVIELGKANSKTLGFLPFAAIKQAALDGRVLAFVEDDEVKGYALFAKRVRSGDISLTHLCVDHRARGQGIARQLVDSIVQRNRHGAGIRLLCRKDYDATDMWPRLGFQPLGEKPGRGKDRLPLVAWWLPIAARTLFDEPEQYEARMVVALDTNIWLDIREQRDFPASLAMTADWVGEAAELAVTEQSLSELSNRRSGSESVASIQDEHRTLESSREAWQMTLRSLQEEPSTSRLEENDLRVVAQATAGQADYLVSRDEELIRHSENIKELTSLPLMTPDDFLLMLQSQGGEQSFETRRIAASGMAVSTATELPSDAELSVYCHHHVGESPSELRRRLSLVTSSRGRIELLVTDSGEPLALGAMFDEEARFTVTALRGANRQQTYTAVRQMAHHLRSIAVDGAPTTITVQDQTHPSVERALRDEGFRPEGSAWVATVRTDILEYGHALPPKLIEVGWDQLTAHLVREYERYAWPSKVFSGSVESYMVPIKPEYARVILGYEEPQPPLFELHPRAAAARDNVYYMSPRRSLEAPARIIWWVSRGGQFGGVRALSWLDEVETGHPRHLYRKYRDRGVLDELQVRESAKPFGETGHLAVTALLFSQTEVFPEPIPLTRARQLFPKMKTEGYFVTARQIQEDVVYKFYEEGMRLHAQTHREAR